jgi:hypothetical protein
MRIPNKKLNKVAWCIIADWEESKPHYVGNPEGAPLLFSTRQKARDHKRGLFNGRSGFLVRHFQAKMKVVKVSVMELDWR